jgi:hypothetical protein
VAQIRYGDGSDAPATEVITVADLLSRNAPAPVREVEPDTGGISVGALLRREGRAPHSADRPLQLRPQQPAPAAGEGGTDRRVLVRRGAIAAGTLLAAGSVLGAALLTDVMPTANQAPAPGGAEDDGPYAGQGLLDPEGPVAAPQDSVVIDQAAARDPLDPGAPAPSDWVPVAFPGALTGENAGTGNTDGGDPGNGGSSSSSGDDGSPAASAAGDDDDDKSAKTSSGSGGSSSAGGSSSSDSDAGDDSGSSNDGNDDSNNDDGNNDDGDGDGGLLDTVGDTVGGVVDTVGGLLGSDSEKSDSSDGDDEDSKSSRSMSLLSADDGDEEDSSAPQDEDDSESDSDAKSSDSDDSEDSKSSDDDGDDSDDGGLVGGLLGTVGGLLR